MRRVGVILTLTLLIGACADAVVEGPISPPPSGGSTTTTTTPTVGEDARAVLAEARALWEAADLAAFSYEFEDDCGECDAVPAREVVVWGDEVYDPERQAMTPEQAFAAIERAIDAGRSVDVDYDDDLGYPTDVWIDPEARVVDGGTHWVFSGLTEGLPGDVATIDDFRQAVSLWDEVGPPSYEFRVSFLCDCPVEGTLWTRVEDGLIVDWDVQFTRENDIGASPITIDQLLADVEDLLGGGFDEDGAEITGTALFDAAYGFPRWIGLDIEVIDPNSFAAALAPRLVFVVDQFEPVEALEVDAELEQARARWEAAELASYTYQLTVHDVLEGSFEDAYLITVQDGVVVGATTLDGTPAELAALDPPTVEELFDVIELLVGFGVEVDVIYDSALGHPVLIAANEPDSEPFVISVHELTEA